MEPAPNLTRLDRRAMNYAATQIPLDAGKGTVRGPCMTIERHAWAAHCIPYAGLCYQKYLGRLFVGQVFGFYFILLSVFILVVFILFAHDIITVAR